MGVSRSQKTGAGVDDLSSAEVYDPTAGASVVLPSMSTPRGFAPGVVMDDGRFAVIGGSTGEDLRTNAWQALPDLPESRSLHAVWSIGGAVVVAGGGRTSVVVLDRGRWRTVPQAEFSDDLNDMGFTLA